MLSQQVTNQILSASNQHNEANKNVEQCAVANPLGRIFGGVFRQLQPQSLRSSSLSPIGRSTKNCDLIDEVAFQMNWH